MTLYICPYIYFYIIIVCIYYVYVIPKSGLDHDNDEIQKKKKTKNTNDLNLRESAVHTTQVVVEMESNHGNSCRVSSLPLQFTLLYNSCVNI